MARQVESNHAFIEQLAYLIYYFKLKYNNFIIIIILIGIRYQLKCKVRDDKIGALMALAKVNSGKVVEFCAREASQILGGNSCIRGGKGERVERMYLFFKYLFYFYYYIILFIIFI